MGERCSRALWAGTFLVWLLAPTVSAATSPPAIRIIEPLDGTVVTSDADVHVLAELAPPFQDPNNFSFIRFTVVKSDGTSTFDLGQGDLRWFTAPDLARGIWKTRAVPSGTYIISAFLQDTQGNLFRDSVQVTLNRAPGLRVVVLSKGLVPGGAEVTLKADARDIEGDPITRALWVPGDGTPPVEFGDLTPFSHVYASVPGQTATYVLTVTVDDARGGRTTVQRDIVVTDADVLVQQTHDCGCNKMDIFSVAGNNSFTFCRRDGGGAPPFPPGCVAVANPAGAEACDAGDTPFQCPLGPFAPGARLGWTFEINAHLDPATNDPLRCTEGQVARGTRTRGGAAVPNPMVAATPPAMPRLPFPGAPAGAVLGRPNRYPPAGGPDWGADDYTAPANLGTFKRKLPGIGRIRWLDAPSISRDGAAALTQHDVFVAWVTGGLGTCWCQFEVNHEWTAAGGRAGPGGALPAPAVITRLGGVNCDP